MKIAFSFNHPEQLRSSACFRIQKQGLCMIAAKTELMEKWTPKHVQGDEI
ncbi:hypothetical protein [Pontixanthobacter sp.]